jgi:hypothetical protein
MGHELMGRLHAAAVRERGQGTVEYVGLILLMAVVIGAVVTAGGDIKDAGIAETVTGKLKDAIDGVGAGK